MSVFYTNPYFENEFFDASYMTAAEGLAVDRYNSELDEKYGKNHLECIRLNTLGMGIRFLGSREAAERRTAERENGMVFGTNRENVYYVFIPAPLPKRMTERFPKALGVTPEEEYMISKVNSELETDYMICVRANDYGYVFHFIGEREKAKELAEASGGYVEEIADLRGVYRVFYPGKLKVEDEEVSLTNARTGRSFF